MSKQSIKSKLGEIRFRQLISQQHAGKKIYFKEEPTGQEIKKLLSQRLKSYLPVFQKLKKLKLLKSPFLEIGSEYALASTLLKNRFQLKGIACDVSFYSLTYALYFAKLFKFPKIPDLICADAYTLPFKSNSFAFVFLYETLHHFPDPKPVLLEIKRVLAPGGVCLIGADPISSLFQLRLWRRPTKLRFWEKLLKLILVLPFISHIGKTEVEHGIIENTFSLKVWQNALNIFNKVEAKITIPFLGPVESRSKSIRQPAEKNWLYPNIVTQVLLAFSGGGLEALCYKSEHQKVEQSGIEPVLICPNCLKKDHLEINLSKDSKSNFACPRCQNQYKKYSNVPVLLEPKLAKAILV